MMTFTEMRKRKRSTFDGKSRASIECVKCEMPLRWLMVFEQLTIRV